MDKIHTCIDLLCDYGYIERKSTLRETYNSIVGIYTLERYAPEMWDLVLTHKIYSLFQMEKQSGINGLSLARPHSVDELAVLNSVIRLMAPEKGAEQPLDMWARYRANIEEWYNEMRQYGLTEKQIQWLAHHPAVTDGICESQEGLMLLLQEEELGGNDLSFADKCRKAIAKKQGKLFEECETTYFENAREKGCDMTLVHYVWDVLLRVQRGYSFCRAHTLAYSLVALQEMNLCYHQPMLFWNTACLINDAGGNEIEELEDEDIETEEFYDADFEDFSEEAEVEDDDEEDVNSKATEKKKKKNKTTNYGKVAGAIGKMRASGISITLPNINDSTYTFSPNISKNEIRYGLSGITRIGDDLVKTIIANRPYISLDDFLAKIKLNKTQMVNLIKSGAFDCFGDRVAQMDHFIELASEPKKRVTLQNMKVLIDFGLLPDKYDFQCRVFNFNKYLKKNKDGAFYIVDDIAYNFYEKHFDLDLIIDGRIKQTAWDTIYKKQMDIIRPYIKEHNQELLDGINNHLKQDLWNKYCQGTLSKWEMDSVSFYYHEHELAQVDSVLMGWADFNKLPEEPEIERFIPIKGTMVPIYKLSRIAGTVLDRDKTKKTVTLLTTSGVVTVKVYGNAFSNYDKQISARGVDGKKHVIEKSLFTRGNKIIVTGIKRDEVFIAKKYARTPYPLVEKIDEIYEDGTIRTSTRDANSL